MSLAVWMSKGGGATGFAISVHKRAVRIAEMEDRICAQELGQLDDGLRRSLYDAPAHEKTGSLSVRITDAMIG